jgi:hypothetical protein
MADRLTLIRQRAEVRSGLSRADAGRSHRCSRCGVLGHTKRTCSPTSAADVALAAEPGELGARLDFDHEPIPAAPPPVDDREPAPEQELAFE